jgi:hypothetical protein
LHGQVLLQTGRWFEAIHYFPQSHGLCASGECTESAGAASENQVEQRQRPQIINEEATEVAPMTSETG